MYTKTITNWLLYETSECATEVELIGRSGGFTVDKQQREKFRGCLIVDAEVIP